MSDQVWSCLLYTSVYETPGGTILMEAHKQLEELITDRDTFAFKKIVATRFSDVVYEGKWFTPLREALHAFIQSTDCLLYTSRCV